MMLAKAAALLALALAPMAEGRPVADHTLRGSCTFQNQWTGETCMEFRGAETYWTEAAMLRLCGAETESNWSDANCPMPEAMAGWCVTTPVENAIQATSMMITPQSDCAFGKMACESFMSGTFEAGPGCSSDSGSDNVFETEPESTAPAMAPAEESSSEYVKPICDNSLTHSPKMECPETSQIIMTYEESSLGCGAPISVEAAGVAPTLEAGDAIEEGSLYALLLVDTSDSPVHPILHYGAVNIPGSMLRKGFSPDNAAEEDLLVFSEYRGPNPPEPGSAWSTPEVQQTLFVYEYMLGEQPNGLVDPSKVEALETMRFDYVSFFEGIVGTEFVGGNVLATHFLSGRCTIGDDSGDSSSSASTDILIESFDEPKFLWESIMVDNMGNMGGGSDTVNKVEDATYTYDFSGYNKTEYTAINNYQEETFDMNMMGWREEYYESIKGSSMEIVDGVLLFKTNISDFDMAMGSMMGNNNGMMGSGSTRNMLSANARGLFPDLRTCEGLKIVAKQTTQGRDEPQAYGGYKVDIGYTKLEGSVFGYGYRASLDMASGSGSSGPSDLATSTTSVARQAGSPDKDDDGFATIVIPFADFTLDWDWDTGEVNTSCGDNEKFCPDDKTLKNMETLTITAVGSTEGVVQELHVKSISGTGCDTDADDSTTVSSWDKSAQWTCSSEGNANESDEILIETMSDPSFGWVTQNDPVMGGESFSSVAMVEEDGTAYFSGEVKDVPFLGVPGYIQMEARGGEYPDTSCCSALKLNVMGMEDYAGYRVSFGTRRAKTGFFAQGYKADFDAPTGEFGNVVIPFNMFSVEWDEATGDQIVACAEDPTVCPDLETLKNMETMAIWGEGVGGPINLYVRSISAVGCSGGGSSGSSTDVDSSPSDTTSTTSSGGSTTTTTQDVIDEWKENNSAMNLGSSSTKAFASFSFALAVVSSLVASLMV